MRYSGREEARLRQHLTPSEISEMEATARETVRDKTSKTSVGACFCKHTYRNRRKHSASLNESPESKSSLCCRKLYCFQSGTVATLSCAPCLPCMDILALGLHRLGFWHLVMELPRSRCISTGARARFQFRRKCAPDKN